VENGESSSNQAFQQRFSQLSKNLNRQLASFQETTKQISRDTSKLSDATRTLFSGMGKIKSDYSRVKIESETDSRAILVKLD